jgi:hypothetical protein
MKKQLVRLVLLVSPKLADTVVARIALQMEHCSCTWEDGEIVYEYLNWIELALI